MAYEDVISEIKVASQSSNRVSPQLLAVSKGQSFEKILSVYQLGHRYFGENYVQEAIEKAKNFEKHGIHDAKIEFIGHLQSNKVKSILAVVDTIHSVDSISLLKEINKRAIELNKKIRVYFQVNIDREASKGGFDPAQLNEVKAALLPLTHVMPQGLMCIPNPNADTRQSFEATQKLSLQYPELGTGLSMGMSDDFAVAIECGATVVRVGSRLFGPRA